MRIEKRTMGWIQKPSAYQYNQQLNAKRRAHAQSYLNQQNALATSIFAAKDTFNHDLTALILQSTVQRIGREAEARAKAAIPEDLLAQLKSKLDTTA
jgi:hypothetical protein